MVVTKGGVNDFVQTDETPIEILYLDDSTAETQLARLEQLKKPIVATKGVRAVN